MRCNSIRFDFCHEKDASLAALSETNLGPTNGRMQFRDYGSILVLDLVLDLVLVPRWPKRVPNRNPMMGKDRRILFLYLSGQEVGCSDTIHNDVRYRLPTGMRLGCKMWVRVVPRTTLIRYRTVQGRLCCAVSRGDDGCGVRTGEGCAKSYGRSLRDKRLGGVGFSCGWCSCPQGLVP